MDTYNTVSLLEFLEYLQKEMKVKLNVSFSSWRPSDQKVYISDLSYVSKSLNWKPRVSVIEGVKRLIRWAKENRSLF